MSKRIYGALLAVGLIVASLVTVLAVSVGPSSACPPNTSCGNDN